MNNHLSTCLASNALMVIKESSNKVSTWADLAGSLNVSFEWDPWLPKGMLTILAGESGIGKSALALRICGPFLMGINWPDGSEYKGETGAVLWCECESFQAGHLERAKKWRYPVDKIYTPLSDPLVDISLDNDFHRTEISRRAGLPEVKLIVVDSLSASSHRKEKDTEIKEVTEFLARLARDICKPVLLTHHLRKKSLIDGEEISLDRLRGSSAIVQAARVIWAVDTPNSNQKECKRLSQVKNNLRKYPDPIGMMFTQNGDLQFGSSPELSKKETQLDKAVDLLRILLESGPCSATYIDLQMMMTDISKRTANEAKKHLNIKSTKQSDGWYWSLPNE